MNMKSAVTTPSAQRSTVFSRGLHIDWILLLATLGTVTTGVLMIHSAEVGVGYGFLIRQIVAVAVGIIGMLFLMLLPYQVFRTYVRPLYILMILVLISVLVIGSNLRGTRGWFHLGPVYLQSSEVAKILYVLTLAGYLDRRIEWYTPKALVIPIFLAIIPIGLILIQPDFSSSLAFFPAIAVMLYVAGARTLHLLSLCLIAGMSTGIPLFTTYCRLLGDGIRSRPVLNFLFTSLIGGWPSVWLYLGLCGTLIVFWWFLRKMRVYVPSLYLWVTILLVGAGALGSVAVDHAIKDYQRKRLVAFVSPELDPLGGGYNVRQSQIAIGSGRLLGKGYGHGTQSRLGFLPSRHTDFIFSVVGEELGFFRALCVLGLYFLVIWRGYEISLFARDRYGSLVAAGFSSMFAFYALLNIGMTMGLAPVAGVPLPMVSYGGSSVVASLLSIGIMLSIHWRRYML